MPMNTQITLEINGYKRNVLRYEYGFNRNTDYKGRPTTGVLGGDIYVEMESDEGCEVLDMMLVDIGKPYLCFFFRSEPIPVSGKIRHNIDDMMFREIAFDEASRIVGEYPKSSQTCTLEDVHPNNFFTRKYYEYDFSDPTTVSAYCFSREDELGNGVTIYVDSKLGKIIGGRAFGD